MNPLLQSALGSVFRWLLAILAGWFVEAGIWSETDAANYVAAAALALVALAWSLWRQYKNRIKFLTALAAPKGATEIDVETKVKAKETPPVSTPRDVPPTTK